MCVCLWGGEEEGREGGRGEGCNHHRPIKEDASYSKRFFQEILEDSDEPIEQLRCENRAETSGGFFTHGAGFF